MKTSTAFLTARFSPTLNVLPHLRSRREVRRLNWHALAQDQVCLLWARSFQSLLALLFLALPAAVQAQYTYTTDNNQITITRYTGTDAAVAIPSTIDGLPVTRIGNEAFLNLQLQNVSIPDSVTAIGAWAFLGCNRLGSVTIPDSVTSIGEQAFWDCGSLINVAIGSSVSRIGERAFSSYGLSVITVDGANSFYSSREGVLFDKSQTTLIQFPIGKAGSSYAIPNSVTNIGIWAFKDCANLTSITIPDSVTNIRYTAFSGCTGLTSATIPDGVTTIGSHAFDGCTGLTNVTIGKSVTTLGSRAFLGCTRLTSVTIPDGVTDIEDGAFKSCTGLTRVTIPDSVTRIEDGAFSGCTGLTSATIPDGVTTIGSHAFDGCTGLTNVTIGKSVTTLGSHAFLGCTRLTSVTIPDGVTDIEDGAFKSCTGLTRVTIPDSVTRIEDGAFSGCTGLTSATIPDGVTTIGIHAFSGCTGLTSITIPDSVTTLGWYAFSGCTGLSAITVEPLNPAYSSVAGVLFNRSRTSLLQYPQGKAGSYTIPDSVTRIEDDAFSGCTGLTSITIPDSVTTLESGSFVDCTGLSAITVGPLNPAYSSVAGVLFDLSRTTLLQYPPGKAGSYTIPDSVTIIDYEAFSGCIGLTSITIPDSVTIIRDKAFSGCIGLTSVTIPGSVTGIWRYAFSGCTRLSAITVDPLNPAYSSVSGVLFDRSRTTLLQYPPGKAGSTYTMPGSVTTLMNLGFFGCASLTGVYFEGNAPSVSSFPIEIHQPNAFDENSQATVYYLPGTKGWGSTFDGRPAVLWNPQVQTRAASFGVQADQFGFTITGTVGLVIVVEACTDLGQSVWTPVGTNTLTGGSSYFSDPQWVEHPTRLYRLRSP